VKLFIAPSLFLLNKHHEFGFDPVRFVHIPNPAGMEVSSLSDQPGGYLLYFGRLSREKGVRTLITAFQNLRTPGIPLYIAGDGPERKDVEQIASQRKNNEIKFMGYLTTEPLRKAIDSARAIILPSEWYENAPMAILESFSRGKPVIGANIGGIPELIDDGVNGYLFEPGNAIDLRNKLELFLALPDDHVREMGRAAKCKVQREYTAGRHYEQLMQAYEQAVGKRRA
jgi:glycosyltransferase involved in cell wall biosynthesis